jgi:hypothetical protein
MKEKILKHNYGWNVINKIEETTTKQYKRLFYTIKLYELHQKLQ